MATKLKSPIAQIGKLVFSHSSPFKYEGRQMLYKVQDYVSERHTKYQSAQREQMESSISNDHVYQALKLRLFICRNRRLNKEAGEIRQQLERLITRKMPKKEYARLTKLPKNHITKQEWKELNRFIYLPKIRKDELDRYAKFKDTSIQGIENITSY